jgi:hypothetical protein
MGDSKQHSDPTYLHLLPQKQINTQIWENTQKGSKARKLPKHKNNLGVGLTKKKKKKNHSNT